jgi:hypothetical protein
LLNGITGTTEPFSADKVRALYPTRDDYVRAFSHAVDRGVRVGYFRAESASDMKAHGEKLAAGIDAW